MLNWIVHSWIPRDPKLGTVASGINIGNINDGYSQSLRMHGLYVNILPTPIIIFHP